MYSVWTAALNRELSTEAAEEESEATDESLMKDAIFVAEEGKFGVQLFDFKQEMGNAAFADRIFLPGASGFIGGRGGRLNE